MKKKIVFIAPHLSTGGMPQYLVKQIELLKNDCEVYCVEWGDVTGGVLVVQRNKMIKLLGDRLITLGEDKHELFKIIERINPDIIHLQEIPELFMPSDVADKLYSTDRNYSIIETSHDSGYNTDNKLYLPDKFLMVSKYQENLYKRFDIPCDVVEYPIENKIRTKSREQALRDLGLDPNLKHVINVGLFTPRKNQAEVIEYARMLQNYPIQFHFIGNQADNFKFYWEPLMQNFPSNCKWWNERSDVDNFYEAADLFLFTSRGHATDMETMPLVIRESLSWKTPSLIYNLPVYMGYFDKYDTIEYLTEDLQKNAYRIAEKLIVDFTPPQEPVFYTLNGEEKLTSIKYFSTTMENLTAYGDAAAQYFANFHLKELERGDVCINEGDVFVDLGTNIGMSSYYAKSKGASEIYCFEPDPNLRTLIEKNVPTAKIYPYAIGSIREEVELYHWPHNPVNVGPKYKSEIITLRDVLTIIKKKIDYLKVDIEGYENNVFDDLTYEEASQIGKMMVEVHDVNMTAGITERLISLGFDVPHITRGHQHYIYAKHKGIAKMKEIVIVSTYPNTKEKEKLLNDTVKKFKSVGKDVLITSHYPVPDYIVEKADYYIYDSKNLLDTNRTLETNGPDYWQEEAQFKIESIVVNHVSSLSRTFSIAMDFVHNLGYEYFLLTESDAIFDTADLKLFDDIRDETLRKKRRVFFFKPLPSEFTWKGSPVYETYCFGGMLKDFFEVFKFPKELDTWKDAIVDMGSVCIEYVLYRKFYSVENEVNIINGSIKRELRNSQIDLYSHSGPSGIYYNINDPLLPVLFLNNHDQDDVEFKYNNGVWFKNIKLNKHSWYYEILDLKNYDNLNVKVEKYVQGKLHSSTLEVLTKENIQNKKSYRTIKFKN